MNATRAAAALIASVMLIAGPLQARREKPGFPKVTPDDLNKNPHKYQGKVVQIEETLAADPVASVRTQVPRFFMSLAEADGLGITSYVPPPAVSKGDRVRITATFRYSASSSGPSDTAAEAR